jgi:[ribosomal protein S18]-alanine N-acetyltransferase
MSELYIHAGSKRTPAWLAVERVLVRRSRLQYGFAAMEGSAMNVRLGLARRDEAAAIADISRALIEKGLPWSWNARRVNYCIENRDSVVLVARDRRRLVGFAIMEFFDERAHLSLLAVLPGYQRRGVGGHLLAWLESSARTAGIFLVHLELRAGNEAARCFYERLGYTHKGRRRAYYAGREDALCMVRDLKMTSAAGPV